MRRARSRAERNVGCNMVQNGARHQNIHLLDTHTRDTHTRDTHTRDTHTRDTHSRDTHTRRRTTNQSLDPSPPLPHSHPSPPLPHSPQNFGCNIVEAELTGTLEVRLLTIFPACVNRLVAGLTGTRL